MANFVPIHQMIRTPDIVGNFQQGLRFGQEQRQQRIQEEERQQLRNLAPKIMQGDPSAYTQAATISPEAANTYQDSGDRNYRRVTNVAKLMREAINTNNPQAKQHAFSQIRPFLSELAGGRPVPETWDDSLLPGFEQFEARVQQAQQPNQQQRNLAVSPGSAIVDPETGAVIYERPYTPANGNIVKVPDGRGGTIDMVWDPRTRQLSDLPIPGQAGSPAQSPHVWAQPGATYQTPNGIVRIDPNIDPADLESAQADIMGGAQSDNYTLPQRTVSPTQFRGGQFGYTPPKAPDAPSGYRYGADGVTLEPVPGGPNDPSAQGPNTKDEQAIRKEVSDLVKQDRSVLNMHQNVVSAAQDPSAAGDLSMIFAFMKMLDPGSVVREQEFANAQNAASVPDQVRNAWNRALSGERLNPQQRADFVRQAQGLADQASQRITNTARTYQGIADQYGYDPQRATGMADFRNVTSNVEQGLQGTGRYSPGQVIEIGGKRYRVTGGDPSDPDVEEVR